MLKFNLFIFILYFTIFENIQGLTSQSKSGIENQVSQIVLDFLNLVNFQISRLMTIDIESKLTCFYEIFNTNAILSLNVKV